MLDITSCVRSYVYMFVLRTVYLIACAFISRMCQLNERWHFCYDLKTGKKQMCRCYVKVADVVKIRVSIWVSNRVRVRGWLNW